jgi:hypothetical protein
MKTIVLTAIGLAILCAIVFFIGFCCGMNKVSESRKKKKTKYPPCTCKDVNQCTTWCQAKHLHAKDSKRGLV